MAPDPTSAAGPRTLLAGGVSSRSRTRKFRASVHDVYCGMRGFTKERRTA